MGEVNYLNIKIYWHTRIWRIFWTDTMKGFFSVLIKNIIFLMLVLWQIFKVLQTPWKSSAYKPSLLNHLKIWVSSMCSTWIWLKILFLGKKIKFLNCTAIHENKRSWSIRNQDPWVGRSKLNQLCFRDRHQILAD